MSLSHELFSQAKTHIPGGVNSPVRAFKGVGGDPVFFKSAKGAIVVDVDDREYIDYVGSWGPMILGHAAPSVIEAVKTTADKGLSFGAPTALEIEMADLIVKLMPSIESVRMVSSGTEATMSAIRLARGYTGRDTIIKFEGCYHGHADSLLVKAGSGALTLGVPSSPGVPAAFAQHTLNATFNDLDSVASLFEQHPNEIAAIIVEPIAGNMNCVPPIDGFLQGLRDLCDQEGSVLIFDEVMTGFRVALGGAQAHYDVRPDITTLGKVIGGGMPVGAFGGKKAIMQYLAPEGPVYQAGTLSGNPVAMAAGIATLKGVCEADFFATLGKKTQALTDGIQNAANNAGIPMTTQAIGGMFGLFFSEQKVTRYEEVIECDIKRFKQFFHGMLKEGIYLAPSAFEAGFVSGAHTDNDIELTIAKAERVLNELK